MGLFQKLFHKDEQQAGAPNDPNAPPPTRWEKAIVALNGIVGQVAKIDPDGVDIVCFPESDHSGDGIDMFRNIKDTDGLEALVNAHAPGGACMMGKAIDTVLDEAFARGFTERSCSVLVLTAGQPDDHDVLEARIKEAAAKVSKDADLTITFVQVGDDPDATAFLKRLDTCLTTTSATGEAIDIVDVIKDEEVQKAVDEFKKEQDCSAGFKTHMGAALMGAFMGAALGAGGMYIANKKNAEKRTQGWNGTWALKSVAGSELATLTVVDDMQGNLTITGFPGENNETTGTYSPDTGVIQFAHPTNTKKSIEGTVEDEHNIAWSNGTRWEEIPPEGATWKAYVGAAAAGAVSAGFVGNLLQKKFFKKVSEAEPSDYIIVLDRSEKMTELDTGK